jgi:hypothetical protein
MLLINKGYAQGDVVSIKLINSDELIAKFESQTDDEIKIHRPLSLTMSPQGGLGMIPWMLLGSDEFITLSKNHVMAISASKKDAADQYLSGTTGIAMR